jgi:hypothetical protein
MMDDRDIPAGDEASAPAHGIRRSRIAKAAAAAMGGSKGFGPDL